MSAQGPLVLGLGLKGLGQGLDNSGGGIQQAGDELTVRSEISTWDQVRVIFLLMTILDTVAADLRVVSGA